MLDLNQLRTLFAEKVLENAGEKGSLDAALLLVCTIAYNRGLEDAAQKEPRP